MDREKHLEKLLEESRQEIIRCNSLLSEANEAKDHAEFEASALKVYLIRVLMDGTINPQLKQEIENAITNRQNGSAKEKELEQLKEFKRDVFMIMETADNEARGAHWILNRIDQLFARMEKAT